MQHELPELSDYLTALRRRRLAVAATAMLASLVTVYLAFGVAPTFRSEATILIEQQDIPEDFVRSTVTGYADQRIQTISQRVMTRDNLVSIAESQELFPEIRAAENFGELADAMRDAISVEMVQVQTLDETRGRTYPITIAFNVGFEYTVPEATRAVARDLSELYLQENARSRSALALETETFLDEEAIRLRSSIDELEDRMADFKAENRDTMPELAEFNREMLRRAETELQRTREAISGAEDRRSLLLAELRTTPSTVPTIGETGEPLLTAEERLRALRGEYLSLSAVYSADHPDLMRLRREIDTLEASVGAGGQPSGDVLAWELATRQVELENARGRYSSDHPTVQRLETVVAELRRQVANSGAATTGVAPEGNNPLHFQLQVQVENVNREIQQLNQRAARLETELEDYTARFARAPETEREWLMLTRDYDIAVSKYQEVSSQLEEARRAVTLESAQKGERFTLIDPARLPEEPIRPNRPVVLLVGLLFGLGACAGIVALLEMLDTTVRGPKGLKALIGVPALAAIPSVSTAHDRRKTYVRRVGIATAFAVGIACMAVIVAN